MSAKNRGGVSQDIALASSGLATAVTQWAKLVSAQKPIAATTQDFDRFTAIVHSLYEQAKASGLSHVQVWEAMKPVMIALSDAARAIKKQSGAAL